MGTPVRSASVPRAAWHCSSVSATLDTSPLISDIIDQTLDLVDEACKTLLAEVLERQGVTEGISFPDFRVADSDVHTFPDMSDEAIVASVDEVSPNDSDEDDMKSDNTGDPGPTVTEAAHCVMVMRCPSYMEQRLGLFDAYGRLGLPHVSLDHLRFPKANHSNLTQAFEALPDFFRDAGLIMRL
ncbi:hypothetical protein HPB51_011633 [Rhipicephalus microplus]|uniref:Uncharacterized protein n=1 Tax=Rhipicephalus microplus TaxID=6941 RepID=A0A9J6ETG0_RHIMP|nr:hypothetical protein HPB51_011633 [Rhipicephalus microplus]